MTIRKRELLRSIPLLSRFVASLERVEAENRRLGRYLWDLSVTDISAATEPHLGSEAPGAVPVPPEVLRYLVSGTDNVEWFLRSGRLGMSTLVETLERNGLDARAAAAVLDFGCGCGRVLRHFAGGSAARLHGADPNRLAIEWCRKNMPFAAFEVTTSPPLSYSDRAFDLIYAFSVFTHLTLSMQAVWMKEMRRVLKDGGHLLVSLHGDSYARRLPPKERAEYRRGHAVVLQDDLEGSNQCNAFHPETYVRQTFAEGFQVLDFRPNGARGNPTQDVYLLERTVTA